MPRKRCCGQIEEAPTCRQFLSTCEGQAGFIQLGLEEVEAIRLKDLEGLEQGASALAMGLTRPTFQRVLASARRKLATALVEGRSIRIQGGFYEMKNRVFECLDCSEIWEEAPCSEGGRHGYEIACPKCGGMRKSKLVDGVRHACGGAGHTHGANESGTGGCGCGGGAN